MGQSLPDKRPVRYVPCMSDQSITPVWRPNSFPRAIAIGLLLQVDALLCAEVTQDDGTLMGYRPLGGGIDMGETSAEALAREFKEEVSATVNVGPQRTVLQNIFTHEGHWGHEIVFVHDVVVVTPGLIAPHRFLREEAGRVTAIDWVPLTRFRSRDACLFPDGLLEHL